MPAKAFQAMAVTAISALSHTVYHAEAHKQIENEQTGLQSMAPVSAIKIVTTKKEGSSTTFAINIPAYCNPEEKPGKANPTCLANAVLNKIVTERLPSGPLLDVFYRTMERHCFLG